MKKIFLPILIFIITCTLFAEEVVLDTSQGDKTVVVPETYEELRQAYLDMAGFYLEERYDLEEALAQLKAVEDTFNPFIEKVDELVESNKAVVDYFEQKNKLRPMFYGGANMHYSSKGFGGTGHIGVILFDKVMLSVGGGYNPYLTFSVGVLF